LARFIGTMFILLSLSINIDYSIIISIIIVLDYGIKKYRWTNLCAIFSDNVGPRERVLYYHILVHLFISTCPWTLFEYSIFLVFLYSLQYYNMNKIMSTVVNNKIYNNIMWSCLRYMMDPIRPAWQRPKIILYKQQGRNSADRWRWRAQWKTYDRWQRCFCLSRCHPSDIVICCQVLLFCPDGDVNFPVGF